MNFKEPFASAHYCEVPREFPRPEYYAYFEHQGSDQSLKQQQKQL